ncbi:hypothetical protein EON66_11545 [archaeon]|nr:MAG: hypothetical protein EON66_11545 [archaeon]
MLPRRTLPAACAPSRNANHAASRVTVCTVQSVDRVGAEDVDELSKAAFPLCMQSMHNALKETHKLKHLGRLQYGLFLKGVGLSLEDALVFWQTEFTRAMTTEEFLKKVRGTTSCGCTRCMTGVTAAPP